MTLVEDMSLDTIEVDSDFASALFDGLSAPAKSIPCRFLYDAAGSALFEKITALPEYYPTRTETEILRDRACEIACETPPGSVLIEFGSGSSLKTELLLAEMRDLYAYIPIDISDAALRGAQARIEERFPDLRVLPLRGDFAQPIPMPPDVVGRPRLGFFPGSTIGNLESPIAIKLLANMAQMLGENGRLVIGADLKKDERQLVSAYDDAAGVTAAFNLNLLKRANRELGADFDVGQFDHLAEYDSNRDRIEIFLVSQAEQTVEVLGRRFRFAAGERVHTEHSHKYDIEGFHALAARAGWRPVHVWTDEDRLFSVHTLETV
jgi:dimethylhistidine N-methyltransferase